MPLSEFDPNDGDLYDYQADTANAGAMTLRSPTSRHRVNRAWKMPDPIENVRCDTARMLPFSL